MQHSEVCASVEQKRYIYRAEGKPGERNAASN